MRASEIRAVLPLADCSPDEPALTGGKARGLHALIELGLPVPSGFAISAQSYLDAVRSTGIDVAVAEILAVDVDDEEKSRLILECFTSVRMPETLAAEIAEGYAALGGGPVAVRSSGIAEDTAAASFAGQHDTYLWIEGVDAVIEHVLKCWASLYNAGAIGYRARFDIAADEVAMAVVVQQMVQARAGGVMMTLEPVTGDRNEIYIEAAHGLGEGVVVGDVLSDQFWFDKGSLGLLRSTINAQAEEHAFDPALGGCDAPTDRPGRWCQSCAEGCRGP